MPFAIDWKSINYASRKIELLKADHSKVENLLAPVMKDLELLADTLGHIKAKEVADTYVNSAVKVRKTSQSRTVRKEILAIFKKRKVIEPVLKDMDDELKRLK